MDRAQIDQRIEDALKMHTMTYNCAQCVALATCDLVGLEKDQMFRLVEGLGGGMGGFTETCGALSGGIPVISMASCNGMEACNSKQKTYGFAKEYVKRFQEKFGSTSCADLRPEEPELRMPTCNKYIAGGVELVIEMLEEINAAD